MKRPTQLIYGVDDKPNFPTLLLLGLQYVVVITAFLLLPVIIMQHAHVNNQLAAGVISTAMLVAGLTAILQVIGRGMIGSGYLILASPNPVFIAPSIIAIQMGGLPVVFAMTLFAGIFQAVISPFFKRLQKFFPAEIGGLIMALIGIETAKLGINSFIGIFSTSTAQALLPSCISVFVLFIILLMVLWGSNFFRLYAMIIALVVGYFLIYITGCMDAQAIIQIKQAHWTALPTFPVFTTGLHFDSSLIIPFAIAAVACAIKVSGATTAHQQLNDADWVRPEMRSISRGSFIDSIGTILCGVLGSFGQNVSSSALGVSLSSGVSCRRVAYSFAAILWLLSFSPKFALILVLTPGPIIAAILVFLSATLLIAGLKTIIPRMTVSYRAVVIGVPFMLGISRDIYPSSYQHLPDYIQSLSGSSIALATISAIVLNFIALLTIDNFKSARISLSPDANGFKMGLDYLESLKNDWDLPASLYQHVVSAYTKLLTIIAEKHLSSDLMTLDIMLARSQLDFNLVYKGHLVKPIITDKKDNTIVVENEVVVENVSSAFAHVENDLSTLHLSFDY